jgi:2-oxoisovalerate dehydrogenase E1 component alpha subunit
MAGTLGCPVIFFCRNNGYAISTPVHEQYKGDGIAARGIAYGLPTIRCDGNDLLAVHDATAKAREMALERNTPVVIEAMTYRGGHHSTSDDSTRYRGPEEISYWLENENPITRMRMLLEKQGAWDSHKEMSLRKEKRTQVLAAMSAAERTKKPAASQMFTDVYDNLTPNLLEQQEALLAHLEKYKANYNLDEYDAEDNYVDKSPADREANPYGTEFKQ